MGRPEHKDVLTTEETIMTRTEQIKMVRRASAYIDAAIALNNASLCALFVGLPVTIAAYYGASIWPGVILWVCSYAAWTVGKWCSATAARIHLAVRVAREQPEQQ